MIVADTSVWIDYFNGVERVQTELLDQIIQKGNLILTDLILSEILQGFESEKDFNAAKENLLQFTIESNLNSELALLSAQNFRFLRRKGVTIRKTIDSLIATFCIENDYYLLHNDKDFIPFEKYLGLKNLQTILQ